MKQIIVILDSISIFAPYLSSLHHLSYSNDHITCGCGHNPLKVTSIVRTAHQPAETTPTNSLGPRPLALIGVTPTYLLAATPKNRFLFTIN